MEGGGTGTGIGIGGSPLAQPQPPPAKDVDEAALALTKRARKRSRYLSPPYTDRDVQEEEVAGEEPPLNVPAAEALSAVLAAAPRHGQGVDPAALRFLALYRRNRNSWATTGTFDTHPGCRAAAPGGGSTKPPSPAAADGGHTMVNLSAGPAIRPGDGSPAPAPAPAKTKKNLQAPPADGHIWAHKSAGFAANAANGLANPAPPAKKKKYKKRMRSAGHEQQHLGNPVALVLDFAAGAPLPSKEDLVSTFRRFGSVIDSETALAQDKHSARVAFATRAEAEAALSCAFAGALGALGPPCAVPSLQDLPPTIRGAPPPVPKLPLTDIRSNLERMIASLNRRSSPFKATGNLVGEMQGLLAKVDKMLQGRGSSATALHH